MIISKNVKIISGFLVLFAVYHFPEFFDDIRIAALFKIGFLIIAWLIIRWQGFAGWTAYGLGGNNRWKGLLLAGFLTGILVYLTAFGLTVLTGLEKIEKIPGFSDALSVLPALLLMTAVPSLAEDILTRGYLFAHMSGKLRPVYWILLSSVIFVLNHIWRLQDGVAVVSYLWLMGMALAIAVSFRQTLWLAFGIHWGSNLTFSFSQSQVNSRTMGSGILNVWILAGSWGMLLIVLLIMQYISGKRFVHEK